MGACEAYFVAADSVDTKPAWILRPGLAGPEGHVWPRAAGIFTLKQAAAGRNNLADFPPTESQTLSRIFLALALFAVLLLLVNLLLGLALGDFGAASRQLQFAQHEFERATESAAAGALEQAVEDRVRAVEVLRQQRSQFWPHIWLGIIAGLVTLLVNSISITYFIGTNRWSQEVVDAFSLDQSLAERSQRLKRTTFPWSFAAILLILVISALGAAADPATLNPNAADWVEFHWGLAMLGTIAIAVCLFKQVSGIGSNYELINEIMVAAEQERERRKQTRESGAQVTPASAKG
jgi:hypothetical protein